jgi:hypothetical protein
MARQMGYRRTTPLPIYCGWGEIRTHQDKLSTTCLLVLGITLFLLGRQGGSDDCDGENGHRRGTTETSTRQRRPFQLRMSRLHGSITSYRNRGFGEGQTRCNGNIGHVRDPTDALLDRNGRSQFNISTRITEMVLCGHTPSSNPAGGLSQFTSGWLNFLYAVCRDGRHLLVIAFGNIEPG